MATRTRSNPARKPAATVAPVPAADQPLRNSFDGVIDGFSEGAAKEHLAWEIAACTAALKGAQAVRETQLAAARRARKAHEDAAAELRKAKGLNELATVQLALARANAEGALELYTRLGQVAAQSAMDLLNESANGLARINSAALNAIAQWGQLQASMPQAEAIEAEVEHVTSPLAATPLVWPAQEATRQAMSMAASAWNDWLGAAGAAANGAAGKPH